MTQELLQEGWCEGGTRRIRHSKNSWLRTFWFPMFPPVSRTSPVTEWSRNSAAPLSGFCSFLASTAAPSVVCRGGAGLSVFGRSGGVEPPARGRVPAQLVGPPGSFVPDELSLFDQARTPRRRLLPRWTIIAAQVFAPCSSSRSLSAAASLPRSASASSAPRGNGQPSSSPGNGHWRSNGSGACTRRSEAALRAERAASAVDI